MRHTQLVRHIVAASLAVSSLSALPAVHAQAVQRTTHVLARDYAFQAPDTLAAGEVGFELDNRGTRFHELIVGRLRPGATGTDIAAAHQRGITLRQLQDAYLAEPVGGALLALAGTRSPMRLVVPLERGQSYVLICQLRDSVGQPQHAMLGMFKIIQVR